MSAGLPYRIPNDLEVVSKICIETTILSGFHCGTWKLSCVGLSCYNTHISEYYDLKEYKTLHMSTSFLEFLLGDDMLVAPVIQKGATERDIYLPKGTWEDRSYPNKRNIINGPIWLRNYSANIDILPYFVRAPTMFRTVGYSHVFFLLVFLYFILHHLRNYLTSKNQYLIVCFK